MTLKFFAGMDAAARIDRALHQRRRLGDFRRADMFAEQRSARLFGKDRSIAGVAQADARLNAGPRLVNAQMQATPMMAKSPRRRDSSRKQVPERDAAIGSSISVSISSGSAPS